VRIVSSRRATPIAQVTPRSWSAPTRGSRSTAELVIATTIAFGSSRQREGNLRIEERRSLHGQVQQAVAREVPFIPPWYKTNVAVFQPDIHGVRLSAIADFTFLKDVYRTRAQ
jgi:hypothetical protein